MRFSLFSAAAVACVLLNGSPASAGDNKCSVQDNCRTPASRRADYYTQLEDQLAGLDTLQKIHIENDPKFLAEFEVVAVADKLGCPFAYVFPNNLKGKDNVEFNIQKIDNNGTVGISSKCAKTPCAKLPHELFCAGERSTPSSMLVLGALAILGLFFTPRPLHFAACLLVVTLALTLASPSSFFANSADATNVVPEGGCDCITPYGYYHYDGEKSVKHPIQLVLHHRAEVTVKVTKNSDGSWDIDCTGGACLSKGKDCNMKAELGNLTLVEVPELDKRLAGHYDCLIMGRPLTLNNSHKATADTRWVTNSSWVAVDPTPTSTYSAHDVAALLRSDKGCEDAAGRLTREQEWMRRGVAEFVSVGSFNRFSLDLLRSGAPADMVTAAQRAAMQEVTHAQLSFAMAGKLSPKQGRVPAPRLVVPDDLPLAKSTTELALTTFTEGCVGEYTASVEAEMELQCVSAARARHCGDGSSPACKALDALAKTLKVIARDEAGHAALAFRAVRWATNTDPEARKQVDLAVHARSQPDTSEPLSLRAAVDRAVRSWWVSGDLTPGAVSDGRVARAVRAVGGRVLGNGASKTELEL